MRNTKEFRSLSAGFGAVILQHCVKHILRQVCDSYNGTNHATDDACICIGVTTLLDGESDRGIVSVGGSWFVWMVLVQEEEAQDHGPFQPPL